MFKQFIKAISQGLLEVKGKVDHGGFQTLSYSPGKRFENYKKNFLKMKTSVPLEPIITNKVRNKIKIWK